MPRSHAASVPFLSTVVALALVTAGPSSAGADGPRESPPGYDEIVRGLEHREGLLDLFVDGPNGRVWLGLPRETGHGGEVGRYLHVDGLVQGLGSNPVGLDRGQLGPARLVRLRQLGGRLLVEQLNAAFRAPEGSDAERRAVEESFATSVLWSGPVAARSADGRALVDVTSFLVRDAHGVASRLAKSGQGRFTLDAGRSAVDPDACLAFPRNVEFEALLTFTGDDPGNDVRGVTPEPTAVTLVLHQSILALPDDGYRPRRFDPREGSIPVPFLDYAAPLDAPIERAWIMRHRLEKTDPTAERSPVREPIVYYVDPATPEPVRGALIDGSRWWAEAFDAAGFVDAFRVELLPAGVHPLDARYNVIQWVHRSTRGWSYGGGVVDPRTGEVVKGHVSLGSLRVRQDRLLFEALLGAERSGRGGPDDPVQLALARIRQLSAHEVGHTLGLTHNFAASTYGGRASVMDYPAPLIRLDADGAFDTREAYGVGVGVWDLHAIRYAYGEPPPGTGEEAWLQQVVREGVDRGYRFLSDDDARPAGAAHPLANLWDNGADPLVELERLLELRRVALERFGRRNLAEGRPLARLEETLATVYLLHRYQLDAVVKSVGGLRYEYAVRGDGRDGVRPEDGERQRRALRLLRVALEPGTLDLRDEILESLVPLPFGVPAGIERFRGRTAPGFDPLAAAGTAAALVVDGLLVPERCARVVDQHRRDTSLPSLDEVFGMLVDAATTRPGSGETRRRALAETVAAAIAEGLIGLAGSPDASLPVRAAATDALSSLAEALGAASGASTDRMLAGEIRRFLERPWPAGEGVTPPRDAPPGSPIGTVPSSPGGG